MEKKTIEIRIRKGIVAESNDISFWVIFEDRKRMKFEKENSTHYFKPLKNTRVKYVYSESNNFKNKICNLNQELLYEER